MGLGRERTGPGRECGGVEACHPFLQGSYFLFNVAFDKSVSWKVCHYLILHIGLALISACWGGGESGGSGENQPFFICRLEHCATANRGWSSAKVHFNE